MLKRKVSLDDFYAWYQENKIRLREDASKYSIYNEQLREEFLKEWPLDRILTMSIDDYVIGKGAKSNSFCYSLERGKYKSLFLGIGGGGSSKFGIYWNEDTQSYKNQANKIIPISELAQRFNKLKRDLYQIIQIGSKLDFDNPIFDMKKSTNEFIGRSAVVTKLLCIYSENNSFLGVNMNSQNECWNRLIPQSNQGGPYRQNHEICKLFSKTYPELESSILGSILFEYSTQFLDDKEKKEEKMSAEYKVYHPLSQTLLQSKNLILRGAPGTGKTYLAKEIAMELTGGNEDQIGFVQFHPSYDYTDFVEGLRPVSNGDGAIEFKLQDGIFKQFCQRAKEAQKTGGQDNFEEAWDLYLEYVNSRDEKEYLTEFSYLTVNSRNNFNINYETKSQGTCLTKFYVYELYKDEKYLKQPYYRNQGKKVLETLKKRFGLKDYISPTEIKTDKNFVFIIDEINRGEISKIFGELFFSIDPGYRGKKGCVSTQYANLHETDEKFYIPENVYIIGTMNDIDRSVDTFDFAMRRRFRFVEVTAESQVGMLDDVLGDEAKEAKKRLRNLNAAIENVQELNSHYHIGPSYFLKLKDVGFDYELLWSDYLKPLLEDYLRGSYEEDETLKTLKKAFNLTNNEQTEPQDTGDNDANH
ncbi:McrB family protein [Streptococcus mitis]|uniref:5-methylcytosine-specific restriction enzyme B n=1 Tax=Streptococcus mitis TaxID=28037 RepID=A0A3R9J3X0_STRMT|nr:McrB family protein [Streptococcus mitis]MBZ2105558.1 McrB family protein [Streptococcus mitis]MBZ2109093.1 McrB family protein [Streptococcus mitis]RSI99298.1 5-methylcytosine-specific restriction enzyme B [Streptococcus mitis]